MARKYVCKGPCGVKYELEDMIVVSGKGAKVTIRWCKSCREKAEQVKQERDKLYETIKELFGISFPTGFMLKQIKQFKDEYGYTYDGMELTLRYCAEDPRVYFSLKSGISIIPHCYEMARLKQEEKENRINSFVKVSKQIETVKVKKLDNTNHYKANRLIDLEDLLND